jgi:hypothetical protein
MFENGGADERNMIIYWDLPSFLSHKYWGTNLAETGEQFSFLASYISSQLENST